MTNLADFLRQSTEVLKVSLSDDQIELLLKYVSMLERWNQHYNLSAIRDQYEMVIRHILDSLAVLPYLKDCQRVLDVGTGAGLPGVVLAISFPQHQFVLLDSNGKKIRFLLQVRHDLQISNITPVQHRVETYHTTDKFDGIITRAVGPISDLLDQSRHLLAAKGRWFAMKGAYPEQELTGLSQRHFVEQLIVPGLNESRHIVIIED